MFFLCVFPMEYLVLNKLAAFKLVAKILQLESNLGIGIFMSNITVIALNKFAKIFPPV